MRKTHHFLLITTLLLSGWIFNPLPLAQAGQLYSVSLNTLPLVGNSAGPFYVEFQLNDGSGIGDGNNTVTLSDFQFGSGGGAAGNPVTEGSATGSLTTGVVLTDSEFFNSFYEEFTPGSLLSFVLEITTQADPITPDQFSFAILDKTLTEIPTFGPGDALLTIDIVSPNLIVQTFSSNPGEPPGIELAAPTVISAPGTLALLLVGLGGLLRFGRRGHGR
ncbi:MAG: NF038129 family PEP-CTERM protein [Candidatus Competibacteraceae bacterium]